MSNIVVISGPSGSGKTTLIKKLKSEFPIINFSISHTTRKRRAEEVDGVDYYFIDEKKFKKMIEEGSFVEWAKVFDSYYGTSVAEVKEKSSGDRILLMDIDVQGAESIKNKFKQSVLIFISPPNEKKLRERLVGREKKEDNEVQTRLKHSKKEIERSGFFDYQILNDELELAYNELKEIFISYLNKISFIKHKL